MGALQYASNMVVSEGPRSLYRGATPALLSGFAEYGVLFGANEAIKGGITRMTGSGSSKGLSLPWQAVAGGLAGICCGAAMGPFELIKCQLQAAGSTQGVTGCVKQVVQQDGIKGLLRGTGSTIARECPFNFVLLGSYELSQSLIERDDEATALRTILSGGVAGTCAWIAILPIDHVKSQIQTMHMNVNSRPARFHNVFLDTLRTVGIRGMYAGVSAVCARAFVANAGLFWGYEQTKQMLVAM